MAQKIGEIKERLKLALEDGNYALADEYRQDTRIGVKKALESFDKKIEKLEQERQRIKKMCRYEEEYAMCDYICGIDEVGRGPLAGPVVAAAVVLPKDCEILYINDSKKLSAKRREELYIEIREKAVSIGIGIVSAEIIDEKNILQATYDAMRDAIGKLTVRPDLLLNDAVHIPGVDIPQIPIIKGDAKSISIAAASIVAKVTRDHMMKEFEDIYPGYDFAGNKGYGTQKHIARIREIGLCPIHRRTFVKNFINEE